MTTTVLLTENTTLNFGSVSLEGAIAYEPTTGLLSIYSEDGEVDDLSVDLTAYGYLPTIGEALVPDYSEHSGLPQALKEAGIAEALETITFGWFGTTAVRMALNY